MATRPSAGHPPGQFSPSSIPKPLRTRRRWVAWKYGEPRPNGKRPKIPIDPKSGRKACVNKPATWVSFAEALAYWQGHPDDIDGIGYVLAQGDGIVGVDLDACRDPVTGELSPRAEELIARLASYAEVSPSGTGLKVFARGRLPGPGLNNRKQGIELYSDARYFAVTGRRLAIAPPDVTDATDQLSALYRRLAPPSRATPPKFGLPIPSPHLSDDDVIPLALAGKNGSKVRALLAGDLSGYESQSEADMALVRELAYWAGRDAGQIERVFRATPLMRWDKWDRSAGVMSYGRLTITKVLASMTDTESYSGKWAKCPAVTYTVGGGVVVPKKKCVSSNTAGQLPPSLSLPLVVDSCLAGIAEDWQSCLFALAQRLQGMPCYTGSEASDLRGVVEMWLHAAKAKFGRAVPAAKEALAAWPKAWASVRRPAGQRLIDVLYAQAKADPPIEGFDRGKRKRPYELVARLCRRLGQGGAQFFLSNRMAGELTGVAHRVAGRHLKDLAEADYLERVSVGDRKSGRASEFVWRGPPLPDAGDSAVAEEEAAHG